MKDTLEILIVDDDAVHRRAVRLNMAGWGYSVTEADDGEEAVRQVRVRTFDLILMDIRMTKMSGLEALEQIKKIQPAVPVIIMTAYASVETAVSAMKMGADDYLTKPLNYDELQIKIARTAERRRLKNENEYLKERLGEKFDRR
ncbi:MAG: sigma-54-dependent Fis family transcriptional regulator, partial [Smithella sp.]|nr:sigma-54-dependent Fis family transcriptional regulator [Smithella sp.]